MKKIFLFISLIVAMASSGQLPWTPGTQPRSLPANRPEDYNLWVRNQFGLPLFNDTTQANTNTNLDTCGRLIFTYDVDDFWVRKCSPVKHWERAAGSVILPTCGLQPGTGVVTYDDSTLNFDISPAIYALCCDHVPRTSPFTHVTLDSNTADNPRIDAIVLTENGTVGVIKGTPDPNPAQPQIGCDFLLTYVTVNAHENIPANFRANPIIYDEGIIPPQWDTLATAVSANFLDQTLPIHLTHDISVGAITGGSSALTFTLTDSSINLADYGVLKFYIRLKAPYPAAGTNLNIMDLTWYLDSNPVSNPLTFALNQFGMQNSAAAYFVIAIPVDTWQYQSLIANRLVIRFLRSNASGMYLDWIQLQTGLVQTGTSVRSFAASGNILFNTVVSNPTSNVVLQMPLLNQLPNTVFLQDTSINFPPHFGKLDLSNDNFFSNTLNVTRIAPGPDGTYLGTEGGTVQWLPKQVDTTIVKNGAYREVNGINTTDTLTHGYWKRDSAVFVYPNTYIGMNSNAFAYEQGATDFWKISSNGFNAFVTQQGSRFEWTTGINVTAANNLTLGNDGNVFTVTGNTQINAITTANWQSGSNVQLIFSGTPTVKNNTAGGAGTATILLSGSADFTAAANDVLSLVYDGTNWHESARKTASGATTQTLQQTFNTEVGGSVLTKVDTIQINTFGLVMIDTGSTTPLRILQRGTGQAFFTTSKTSCCSFSSQMLSTNGAGVLRLTSTSSPTLNQVATLFVEQSTINGFQGAHGISIDFIGSDGGLTNNNAVGINVLAHHAVAEILNVDTSSTSAIIPILQLLKSNTGAALNGSGGSIEFWNKTSTTTRLSNQIISSLFDATDATRTSQLDITGVNSASTNTIMSAHGSGVVGIGVSSGYAASRLDIIDNNIATAGIMVSMTSTKTDAAKLLRLNSTGTTGGILANSTAGTAIQGVGTTGTGISGQSNSSTAVDAQSSSGYGLVASSTSGIAGQFVITPTATGTIQTVLQLNRQEGGASTDGTGGSLDLLSFTTTQGRVANQLIWKWTTAADATRTSQLSITGVKSAGTNTLITIDGSGFTDIITNGGGSANALRASAQSGGIAMIGQSGAVGGFFTGSSFGTEGISNTSSSGIPVLASNSGTNAVGQLPVMQIQNSGNTPTVGDELLIRGQTKITGGTTVATAGLFGFKMTNVTSGSTASQFLVQLNSGTDTGIATNFTVNSDGSVQWRPITATAASAITPAEGMQLFVSSTNGTFTSIGMWDYENGAWHKM